ncbi:MAG: MFS transporter [Candidatus Heimdallarchaeota archaeon]
MSEDTPKPKKDNFYSRLRGTGAHQGILINILIVNFFYRIFGEGFRVLLVPFAAGLWTEYQYGIILAVGGYAAMAFVFVLGIVVDIQFKRTTMIIGIIFTIASALVFSRVSIFGLSITFYALFAIGQQLMMISTSTFIANETKKGQHRTFGFTGNQATRGVANAIAPIISMYLLKIGIDYTWVFTIITAFAVISLILVFTLKLVAEESPKAEIEYAEKLSEESEDDFTKYSKTKDGKRSILGVQVSFGIGRMLMGFTSGVAIPFVGWYVYTSFLEGVYTESAAIEIWGWINCIHWVVLTLGYLLMGAFAEKIGKSKIVVIFWALVIPAAVGIWLAQSLLVVVTFYIMRSFFAMTPGAAWNSFLYEWIPPKHRGKTLGLLQTGQRGTRSTGTLLGGLAYAALGASLFPIAMTAYPIAGLLPLIQSYVVKRRLKKQLEEAPEIEPIEDEIIPIDVDMETKP